MNSTNTKPKGFRIANNDRPGYFWSAHFNLFCSEFGDDIKVYRQAHHARKAIARLSKIYSVSLKEVS